MDKTISLTEALTTCSLDEASRLSAASDLRSELQRRAEAKAAGKAGG